MEKFPYDDITCRTFQVNLQLSYSFAFWDISHQKPHTGDVGDQVLCVQVLAIELE